MGLKLKTASNGSVSLEPTNTASDYTLTVPAQTGTVAINGPAFSAYLPTNQSISNDTFTKVQASTEEFDTASCYDNATNYRFTPNVAGYYQVNGCIGFSAGITGQAIASIYKNGAEFKRGGQIGALTNNPAIPVSALVYLNGSTDYVELYGLISTSTTPRTFSVDGVKISYFQASMVRAA
jgi:hypothetical protein